MPGLGRARKTPILVATVSLGGSPLGLLVRNDVLHFTRSKGHAPAPGTKPSRRVNSLYPLVQRRALCPILLAIPSLYLKHQCFAGAHANQEVGDIPTARAVPHVVDLKAEVVVLRVGQDIRVALEDVGRVSLP